MHLPSRSICKHGMWGSSIPSTTSMPGWRPCFKTFSASEVWRCPLMQLLLEKLKLLATQNRCVYLTLGAVCRFREVSDFRQTHSHDKSRCAQWCAKTAFQMVLQPFPKFNYLFSTRRQLHLHEPTPILSKNALRTLTGAGNPTWGTF